jgi:hypothetical protein
MNLAEIRQEITAIERTALVRHRHGDKEVMAVDWDKIRDAGKFPRYRDLRQLERLARVGILVGDARRANE